MNRLTQYIETGPSGEKTGRTAYALDARKLPVPEAKTEWKEVPAFNAAEALLSNAGLKAVFISALSEGYAIVSIAPTVPKAKRK